MARSKYKFNPKTLSFEEERIALLQFIYTKILPKFALTLVLGMSLGVWFTYNISSPAEREVADENAELKQQFIDFKNSLRKHEILLSELQNRDDNVYRNVFQKPAVSVAERRAGVGGAERYEHLRGYSNSNLMIETAFRLDVISRQMIVQAKSHEYIVNLVKNKEKWLACIPSVQPIAIKACRSYSAFGYRLHPILKVWRMHSGVDLTAPTGTDIYATGGGVVVHAGHQGGYGLCVMINHGNGYSTVYAHMSKINVEIGQNVIRGDVIGLVGNTGLSTSPHCHYEVRINNRPVNPLNYYQNDLTEEEYQQMLKVGISNIYE